MKSILTLWLATLTLLISSCASVPGGKVSEEEINAQAEKAYREVLAKTPRSHNAKWTAMVQRVADRIAASANEPAFKWEIVLLENSPIPAYRIHHQFPVVAVIGIFHPKLFVAKQLFRLS